MDGLENIRAALAEVKSQHSSESQNNDSQEQTVDFVDEVVPHTSANKETMYSGK